MTDKNQRGGNGGNKLPQEQRRLRPVDSDYDPFATDSDTYDINKFYTRAVDPQGHKETVHTPLMRSLLAVASEIASDKQFPQYRNLHDFIRDSMVHRAKYLTTHYAATPSTVEAIKREEFLATIEAHNRELQGMMQMVDDAKNLLNEAKGVNDKTMIAVVLDQVRLQADAVREPYRGSIQKLVKDFERELD